MIENVIFDFDGTLVDSSGDVLICLKRAFAKAKIPFDLKDERSIIGPPLNEMIKLASPNLSNAQVGLVAGNFRSLYDSMKYKKTRLFGGARTLLRKLSKDRIGAFIVTNKRMPPTKKILKALDIFDHFKDIYAFDMKAGTKMSKAKMVGLLLRSRKLNRENTLLAGDNESDIIAARNNGLTSVAVLGGYGEAGDLRRVKPTYIIKNIKDLYELILKINAAKKGK